MKAIVRIEQEGSTFVATDLVTQVADQGRTRDEAIRLLRKGLRERMAALEALARQAGGVDLVEFEA